MSESSSESLSESLSEPESGGPERERAPLVKVCGVTRAADARACAQLGVDWIGLNCWPGSKRHVTVEQAAELAAAIREESPRVRVVGLFVNQAVTEVQAAAERVGLDMVQLHGDESEAMCAQLLAAGHEVIKALGLASAADAVRLAGYPCATVLADTPSVGYGGSGRVFDWSLVEHPALAGKRVVLAGGLTPDNVPRAIAETRPYAVDTASGVESAPGVKDIDRVARFVSAVRGLYYAQGRGDDSPLQPR